MTADRKSWRDVLPVHPAADLFPAMSREELIELGEDIKKNGLQTPVMLTEHDGRLVLLDGRNRLDAMELVGLSVTPLTGLYHRRREFIRRDVIDPYAYVTSLNLHRRNLTTEQKREVIAKLLKAAPEKSNRQIAEQVKVNDKTVGRVRAEQVQLRSIPQLDKTTGKDGKSRPATMPRPARGPLQSLMAASKREAKARESAPVPADDAPHQTAQSVNARWRREASAIEIARAILGTLTYEPHAADTGPLRRVLQDFIAGEEASDSRIAEAVH